MKKPLQIRAKSVYWKKSPVCSKVFRTNGFERNLYFMKIVVKVGTSTLAHPTGQLNIRKVEEFCRVLSDLKNA